MGTHVHLWLIHFNVWQNQYSIVKQNKVKIKIGKKNSLVTQLVKNLPAKQETWVQYLGQDDPLEKEMAIHSIILAWRIPWREEMAGYSP